MALCNHLMMTEDFQPPSRPPRATPRSLTLRSFRRLLTHSIRHTSNGPTRPPARSLHTASARPAHAAAHSSCAFSRRDALVFARGPLLGALLAYTYTSNDSNVGCIKRTLADEVPTNLIDQAMRMLTLKRYAFAERKLKDADEHDAKSGRPSFLLGLIHALIYDDDQAAATHFDKAALRDPSLGNAHNNYAVCSYLVGRTPHIVRSFSLALEHHPDKPAIMSNIQVIIERGDVPRRHMDHLVALYDKYHAKAPPPAADEQDRLAVDMLEEQEKIRIRRASRPYLYFSTHDGFPEASIAARCRDKVRLLSDR